MANAALDRRPSPIAGTWYPANPETLRKELKAYLANAPLPQVTGRLQGLIVPHAGYFYSGQCAAFAFKALETRHFDKVVLISPSHRAYPYPLLTSGHEAYSTPLGDLLVDRLSLQDLDAALAEAGLELSPVRNDQEHSLEIELPFLQLLLGNSFGLVPIMMPDQSRKTAKALAAALAAWLTASEKPGSVLLVASSDQSHFYHAKRAEAMDRRVIEALEAQDLDLLYQLDAEGRGEACGLGPMATVLMACQALGETSLKVVDHRNSAAASGDESSVVGYTSAILTVSG